MNMIRAKFKALKETLAPMTPQERVSHLWEYYKIWLGVLAFVIFILVVVITAIINLNHEMVLNGVVANLNIEEEGLDALSDNFFDELGADPEKNRIGLSTITFQDPLTAEDGGNSYVTALNIVSQVSAETLDYVLMDTVAIQYYVHHDLFLDLRDFLTEEELAQFEGKVVMVTFEEYNETIPVAIDIQGTPFANKYITGDDPMFFAVIANTPHMEACHAVWDLLMEE